MSLEEAAIYFWFAGIGVAILGGLWLWLRAFRTRIWWGLGFLIVLPIPVYIYKYFRRALPPLLVCVLGAGLVIGAWQMAAVAVLLDLEGIETVNNDGEKAITLTGWKYKADKYAFLKDRPDTVVLQMANSDVTDDTLKYLQNMKRLKKLDLNDTQVSDVGLALLKELPALESLDLKNTKITDAGFREHLMGMESLRNLRLTGTGVSKETAKEWRAAQKGRKTIGP